MRKVIILGNDHTNTLGIVQTLGREGFETASYVWGVITNLVKSSRYATEVYSARDCAACVERIINNTDDSIKNVPIIACSDEAALTLEKYSDRLKTHYLFEHTIKNWTIREILDKNFQVRKASECGFNVPKTWSLGSFEHIPENIAYPCIIKPEVSCMGAKVDLRVCQTKEEVQMNLISMKYTKEIIIQEYIDRDYEISILGCALSNGDCLIPCVENKFTLYPKLVGLECLAEIQPLKDENIVSCIKRFIREIGYVGLFSIEMMHSAKNGQFYFTEINPRNDGANSFVYKYGVNLPLAHIMDLNGEIYTIPTKTYPGYYIWDIHHYALLLHGEISFSNWIKEIKKSKGFLTYFSEDKMPFFKQYFNWFLHKIHLRNENCYE